MEMVSKLNLTRKWRSKTFNTIVGQDVSVRILKNSLFLDQIFPVYLFSGQRGCGKTSTARVFTAALNCSGLNLFRTAPKINSVPCLSCDSCLAMENGRHPDFTEIDAASHTGVDHIRQLIETTSFLPIFGRKKVYLIDEVHMLSKAAFNALLKILEEPPMNVVFILATTDPHKVLDTVKSRCFQLFFGPPKTDQLLSHLEQICVSEKIKADPAALSILIRESEGSVRDAINLLEQVRFIEAQVSIETVSRALGYVSDAALLNLLNLALGRDVALVKFIAELELASKNIDFVWRRFCELLKMVIYAKNGVNLQIDMSLKNELSKITNKFELGSLIKFLTAVIRQEQVLLKTAHKALSLELFFLQHADLKDFESLPGGANLVPVVSDKKLEIEQGPEIVLPKEDLSSAVEPEVKQDAWQHFLGLVVGCDDPILISIFKQAQFDGLIGSKIVQVSFSDQGLFFKDLILEKKSLWQDYLTQVFGDQAQLQISFVARPVTVLQDQPAIEKKVVQSNENLNRHLDSSNLINRIMAAKQVDVSDQAKWPLANEILAHFPGQVYEVVNE